MKTKFELVTIDGTITSESSYCFRKILSKLGYTHKGQTKTGRETVLRSELQNQPKFTDLCGPMYGGEREGVFVVRYETPEINARLNI